MPDDLAQKYYTTEEAQNLPSDDWQIAFSSLSVQVQEWLCSENAANNNRDIAKKFNLPPNKNPLLAYLTGQAILKKIPVDSLVYALQRDLEIDELAARQITLEVIYRQFLPISGHFPKLKDFIERLGGETPEKMPEAPIVSASAQKSAAAPANQKAFRQAVKDNKETLNQLLTPQPLKIAGMNQPVRPTVKNWLADYIKQKGAGHHEALERSDFVFKNPNFKELSEKDQAKVMAILHAYDDDIALPIVPTTGLFDTEKLAWSGAEIPAKRPSPPANIPAAKPATRETDGYREQLAKSDLEKNFSVAEKTANPVPKLSGNIIDLSDFNKEQL
ncbi:MAG: hypothetical protein PHW33_01920 [Candidatus Portnoybacteria bacterium]|jgi:hypothetical protein|nr:hypothetical protein [Candidatus Portnoybacteria bacterium]